VPLTPAPGGNDFVYVRDVAERVVVLERASRPPRSRSSISGQDSTRRFEIEAIRDLTGVGFAKPLPQRSWPIVRRSVISAARVGDACCSSASVASDHTVINATRRISSSLESARPCNFVLFAQGDRPGRPSPLKQTIHPRDAHFEPRGHRRGRHPAIRRAYDFLSSRPPWHLFPRGSTMAGFYV